MKKTLLSLSAILWGFFFATAQNYQTVNSGRIALFEDDNHLVQALRIDSVHVQNNDSILFPFTNIRPMDENGDCFSPYAPSWIGQYVIVKTNGLNLFFNKNGDTVKVETQAQLNDSWIFYVEDGYSITATITAHDTMSFLGQLDSVKTISFQAYLSEFEIFNDIQLLFSKNYGLLSVVDFYNLFDSGGEEDGVGLHSIIGMTNPEIGVQNLTWFDVHDFQVGDIHHIHTEEHFPDYFKEEYIAYEYLERTDYLDSIVYRVETEKLSFYHAPSQPSEYIFDTIDITIYNSTAFNKLSFEPYFQDNGNVNFLVQENTETPTKVTRNWEEYFQSSSDCWEHGMMTGTCYEPTYFINRLGGPYIISCPFNMYSSVRELVYYQKGDDEWGEPLDFAEFNPPLNLIGDIFYSCCPVYYRIDLYWDVPDTNDILPSLLGYNIYLNNDSLDFVACNTTEYHYDIPSGYDYSSPNIWYVKAVYESPIGISEASNAYIIDDWPISVKELNEDKYFTIHPNPAKEKLQILIGDKSRKTNVIEILNVQGEVLKTYEANESNLTIDIEDLAKGLYFVKLGTNIQKLIIE